MIVVSTYTLQTVIANINVPSMLMLQFQFSTQYVFRKTLLDLLNIIWLASPLRLIRRDVYANAIWYIMVYHGISW